MIRGWDSSVFPAEQFSGNGSSKRLIYGSSKADLRCSQDLPGFLRGQFCRKSLHIAICSKAGCPPQITAIILLMKVYFPLLRLIY